MNTTGNEPTGCSPSDGPLAIGELLGALDAGEPLLLLDVRNEDDEAAWKIEALRPVHALNIPYFAFLEDGAAAIARVPRDRPIVVLCAKGGSSAMVVEVLREAGIRARNVEGGMAAYGDHLEALSVSGSSAGRFGLWQVNRRGKGCLSYVVCAGDEALIVDPSRHVEWYEAFVERQAARIVRVLDTHVHADHLSGGPALARRARAAYSIGAGKPDAGAGGAGASSPELRHAVEALADAQRLRLGSSREAAVELEVFATPGHTPGSGCFLLAGQYLLSGDTLFVRGVGRPDLGGQAEAWGRTLFRTLHGRLAKLPDATVVLPAHSAGLEEAGAHGLVRGTIGAIRRSPEFQIATEDEFVRRVALSSVPAPEAYAAIVRANLGPGAVEPELAQEWELGKNRCAASAPASFQG